MREFKFRAWNPKTNKMMFKKDGTLFFDSEGAFPDKVIDVTHGHHKWEWMQYTGVKDKNGKEVFEGDVVKNNDELCDIYYSFEGAWKMGLNGQRKSNDHVFLQEEKHSEVIGNIYENPELCQ